MTAQSTSLRNLGISPSTNPRVVRSEKEGFVYVSVCLLKINTWARSLEVLDLHSIWVCSRCSSIDVVVVKISRMRKVPPARHPPLATLEVATMTMPRPALSQNPRSKQTPIESMPFRGCIVWDMHWLNENCWLSSIWHLASKSHLAHFISTCLHRPPRMSITKSKQAQGA